MKDFGTIDFVTGSFPATVAKNSSGPTVRDGTPVTKQWVDELFGSFQAMLKYTGITASGTAESAADAPESVSSSQVLEAIRKMAGAPGEVVYFAGRDPDPLVHQSRIIQLTGQGVLIADYPDLVEATYCGDANNNTASSFYKTNTPLAAPPGRTTAGTYMMLPDCRGKFLRSLNGTASVPTDIDRNLNSLNDEPGSAQLSQAGTHDHNVGWDDGLGGAVKTLNWAGADSYWVGSTYAIGVTDIEIDILNRNASPIVNGTTEGYARTTDGGFTYGSTDTETRPWNIAFYAMIRY